MQHIEKIDNLKAKLDAAKETAEEFLRKEEEIFKIESEID